MDPLAPRLKKAREERGLSLREIATTTKISMTALEALERGDFSRLPGGIYSRSFIRSYAGQVGLDPEITVEEFRSELLRQEAEASKIRIRPAVTADDRAFLEQQRRAIRVARIVLVVAGVVVTALLIWAATVFWPSDDAGGEPPPMAEARLPLTPPPPASPLPASEPAGESEQLRVAFEVTDDCWIKVSADGLVVLSRLMSAGERQEFSADHEFVLDVGNAGAFSWTINGRSANSLGQSGEHRQVRVTRESVAAFLQERPF
jgi:cytoskeletal protein RodZ